MSKRIILRCDVEAADHALEALRSALPYLRGRADGIRNGVGFRLPSKELSFYAYSTPTAFVVRQG